MRAVFVLFFCFCIANNFAVSLGLPYLEKASDIALIIPDSEKEIQKNTQMIATRFQEELGAIISIKKEHRTFENTVKAWDLAVGKLQVFLSFYEGMGLIHPKKQIREGSLKAQSLLQELFFNTLAAYPEIYEAFFAIKEKKAFLLPHQTYYLEELLLEFERLGCHLDADRRKEISVKQRVIGDLCSTFQKNIQEDSRSLLVLEKELTGLSKDFISSLEKSDEGMCKLTLDYPTYFSVIRNCSNVDIRKQLFQLFNSRAYPSNEKVLQSLIKERDLLAKLLGFSSFADYDLQEQMAKKVGQVEEFLSLLSKAAAKKTELEFQSVTQFLPEGVSLTSDGRLYAYDVPFVFNQYRKKQFLVDELEIAEYFPLDKVIKGLISIYEPFFGLKIQEVEVALWDEKLKVLELTSKSSQDVLGYVILDLFPRENKYTHACECMLIPGYQEGNRRYKALSLVVANFPMPSLEKPSLLTHEQVRTLFHEFGHATHEILGSSDLMTLCGTRVKTDFVEMPSQLLENWLYEPSILRNLTSHYVTGESLPEEKIRRLLETKNSESGFWIERQCFLASLSLECFKEGSNKDPLKLSQEVRNRFLGAYFFEEDNFFPLSFGHLDGYSAKYYSYLWSKVFSADVFSKIKKEGLLNSEIGTVYIEKIIGKGGEQDPGEMLEDFLGRKPSLESFIESLGVF